jgi:Macrocin-O-methyltransferase (TylF)
MSPAFHGMEFDQALALGKSRSDCAPENIDSLVALIQEIKERNVPGAIVECGSYRCGATIAMAAAAPQRTVFAFDLFGMDRPAAAGPDSAFAHVSNGDFEEIADATRTFGNICLVPGHHEVMVPKFPAVAPIALLFMDSDFYESHRVCLHNFWPMVSDGGIVVFHDPGFEEVQRAIAEAGIGPLEEVPGSPNMRMIRKTISSPGSPYRGPGRPL